MQIPRWLQIARRTAASLQRGLAYRWRLARGKAAGTVRYQPACDTRPRSPVVELRVAPATAAHIGRERLAEWCARQTLAHGGWLRPVEVGTAAPSGPAAVAGDAAPGWFAAPDELPTVEPAFLESCLLVAAAEEVDAVTLLDDPHAVGTWRDLLNAPRRARTLFATMAFELVDGHVVRRDQGHAPLVKVIDDRWGGEPQPSAAAFGTSRRGPYRTARDPGAELRIGIRDVAEVLRRPAVVQDRVPLLVTVPFLATGGAEHTLYETLAVLVEEFDVTIATLAPHAPERGDRRDDFRRLTDRVFCLGDLVHPDAMEGIVVDLLRTSGAEILYNANGTTLFYELAPRLKRRQPSLRIVDHLYDHRIGYIDWYTPEVRATVDVCIAENHKIAATLVAERGWPVQRVPVIWPCGRRPEAFPPPGKRATLRRRLRAELGLAEDAVVFVTAARMHEQKRPLDLVRLADRVRDLELVQFLVVGGGPLEGAVDDAIAAAGAPIRRLPFRNDIPELLVAADIGCLVSAYEGLPVFLLECLQLGLPFLGTDVGDLGEVLRTTGAGLVVSSPGDLDALEVEVRRLADPALRAELGRCATAAAGRFDPTACAAAYRAALLGT